MKGGGLRKWWRGERVEEVVEGGGRGEVEEVGRGEGVVGGVVGRK